MASTIKNPFWKETLAAIAEIQISIQFNKSEKILEFNIFGNYLFKVGNRLIQKGEFIYIWNKKLYQVLNLLNLEIMAYRFYPGKNLIINIRLI